MSAFGFYLVGLFLLIIGLTVAAFLLNVPTLVIITGVVILFGAGLLLATRRTRRRDPPTR